MISNIEELDLESCTSMAQFDSRLQEKLGIGFAEMQRELSRVLQESAEEVAEQLVVIAPHDNYAKMLESPEEMLPFLKEEASKPEYWQASFIGMSNDASMPDMLGIEFLNSSVNDGNSLTGYVYVSFQGKIRHAFVQGEE